MFGGNRMKSLKIEWDKDYGCQNRSGWSVVINGSFCAELEKYLFVAILKATYCYWFKWDKEYREI